MDQVNHLLSQYGYAAIFGLLMLGIVGPLIPDETILVTAGVLVHRGQLRLIPVLLFAYAGSLCGITLSYVLGRTGGLYALQRIPWLKRHSEKHMAEVEQWFHRFGNWTLFFGYFIAGLRHVTALAAGMMRMTYGNFAGHAYFGALFWVASFVTLGYFAGEAWPVLARYVHGTTLVLLIVFAIGIGVWIYHLRGAKPSDVS